jgi:hypothetical protein
MHYEWHNYSQKDLGGLHSQLSHYKSVRDRLSKSIRPALALPAPLVIEPQAPVPVSEHPLAKDTKKVLRDWLIISDLSKVIAMQPGADIPAPAPKPSLMMQVTRIKQEVCAKHQVSLLDIIADRRDRISAAARQELCYRLSTETGMSFPQIGRTVGGRDHTTIMYNVRRHKARLQEQGAL